MMMMMADNTTGINGFGQVPSGSKIRPLIDVKRQQTTGFDVSQVPNAFTGQVVGNITTPEIPRAFGGAGGGNTLKDAQIQASFVTPQQTAFGSGTTTYKFASTQAQVTVDEKGGTANLSREQAKKQPGVASDDVVSGAGATYTD